MTKNKKKTAPKKTIPVWVWIGLPVLLVVIIAVIVLKQPTAVKSLPAEVTVEQAMELRDEGAFILDVREPDEWKQFHIPGATLIPLGELAARVSEVPQDKQVVVVCRTGRRSLEGRNILVSAGFSQVTSMTGGVTEWQAQGLPIATGE